MDILLLVLQITFLIALSALCSGLNISLMSLDISDLKRKAKLGNARAKRVLPLRKNVHLSLASILFTNVAAVSASSLVLESKLNGILAGLLSTILIVIFGEILPQAYFVRRALWFCSKVAPLLRGMILLTYPISKPLQLLLDKSFGKDRPILQSRHELGLIMGEHSDNQFSELDEDEIEIVKGALSLSEKRVREITTPIKQVYWLTPDTVIDADRIDEIKLKSRSRIPVLNQTLTECYGVLLMKELVDINFDEQSYRVDELPLHKTIVVGSMTALDTMFRKFIASHSHLLPVERDDKIIGIVTIEDLIEEIIGHEILDEVDRTRVTA